MIDQRPLDAIKVEDHPEIELRKEGDLFHIWSYSGVGVGTHMVRERVHRVRTPTEAARDVVTAAPVSPQQRDALPSARRLGSRRCVRRAPCPGWGAHRIEIAATIA